MRKKFTTTIDENILKEIKVQAVRENLSVSELIEKMFEKYNASINVLPGSGRDYSKFVNR